MQRKSFGNMKCPIARSLDRVGEWWSILILRDAFYGLRRFDEFQKSLGRRSQYPDPSAECAGRIRAARAPPLQRPSAPRRICADQARAGFPPDLTGIVRLGLLAISRPKVLQCSSSTAEPAPWSSRCWSIARPANRSPAPIFRSFLDPAPMTACDSDYPNAVIAHSSKERKHEQRDPRPRRRPRDCARRSARHPDPHAVDFASTRASASPHSACSPPRRLPGMAGTGGRSGALSKPPTTPMSAAMLRRCRRMSPGS